MKFWLGIAFVPTTKIKEVAQAAEQAGFVGVAMADHAVNPRTVSSPYPYLKGGERGIRPSLEWPDPFVAAAAMGAQTTNLRFTTNVLVAPLRHPVLLAKSVATASALTGGRVDLGLGIGWMREEFDALGIDFATRAERTEETVEALRMLLSGDIVEYHGRHINFPELAVQPAPAGPVSIYMGGHSEPAIRRAARLADGWTGVEADMDEIPELVERVRTAVEMLGRGDQPFPVRVSLNDAPSLDNCMALCEAGVTEVTVLYRQLSHPEGRLAAIRQYGMRVLAGLAGTQQ
ncbi:MAG: TIGR03619 family F420-dependent LLM class oxidoreductase [Acidimicrobiales bacterium]